VSLNIFSNGFYAAARQTRDGGDAGFMPTLNATTRDAGNAVDIGLRDAIAFTCRSGGAVICMTAPSKTPRCLGFGAFRRIKPSARSCAPAGC
jgi:hypothetical protein